MNIQKIIGEDGPLSALCSNGACPAVLIADNGDIYVQGYLPAAAESSQLTAPNGEGFVRMSRSTFESIAKQVLTA